MVEGARVGDVEAGGRRLTEAAVALRKLAEELQLSEAVVECRSEDLAKANRGQRPSHALSSPLLRQI